MQSYLVNNLLINTLLKYICFNQNNTFSVLTMFYNESNIMLHLEIQVKWIISGLIVWKYP